MSITLISDQNPKFPTLDSKSVMSDTLSSLVGIGGLNVTHDEVEGVYEGKRERSYHVNNLSFGQAVILAKMYGQESVCYKAYDRWILVYVNGPNANKYLKQVGDEKLSDSQPSDNYTKYSDDKYFQIDFDWGNFKEL